MSFFIRLNISLYKRQKYFINKNIKKNYNLQTI